MTVVLCSTVVLKEISGLGKIPLWCNKPWCDNDYWIGNEAGPFRVFGSSHLDVNTLPIPLTKVMDVAAIA